MRRIGRDKVQLAALTAAGLLGFVVLLALLGEEAGVPRRGWAPAPGALLAPGRGPIAALPSEAAGSTLLAEGTRSAAAGGSSAATAGAQAEAAELAAAAVRDRSRREVEELEGRSLPPPARVSGQVVDPAGRGVQATLQARSVQRRQGRRRPEGPGSVGPLETAPDGRFELELPPGEWALWATAEGFAASDPARLPLGPGEEKALEEPLRLLPAGVLRGRVQDALGQPLPGARVSVDVERQEVAGEADAQGAFALVVPEGVWTVEANAPGHVDVRVDGVPVALETGGEVTLTLARGGGLEGTVLDADGRPLAGAPVFAYREGQRLGQAQSDEQGRFALEGLPAGAVELFVRSQDKSRCARSPLEVAPGETRQATVRLAAGAAVVGRVTSRDGQPVAGVPVHARSVVGSVFREGKTDDRGEFTVGDLYPGRYRVSVPGTARDAPRAEALVELDAGQARCDLVARSGAVLAGVVEGPDGRPVAQAGVFALEEGRQRAEVQSDDQGAFRIEGLPPGTYRVYSRRGEELTGTAPALALAEDAVQEGLRITLRAPARLRGRVLDPSGQPVADLELVARGRDTPVRRQARTDAEGRFEMAPFYDGGYQVSADGGGLALEARRRGAAEARLGPAPFEVAGGRDVLLELRLELTASPAPR